jgi:hypothetical protein
VKISLIAGLIASLSLMWARRNRASVKARFATADAGQASLVQLLGLGVVSILLFVTVSYATAPSADRGPYLAMPLILVGLVGLSLPRIWRRGESPVSREHAAVVTVIAVFALASLARVLLRVRSGGSYSSYLLPASVILFTYAGSHVFPGFFRDGRAGKFAHRIFLGLVLVWVLSTAVVFSVRYRRDNNYRVTTQRGTVIVVPALGKAFEEAIELINSETLPGDPIAAMPEGSALSFLTGRTNPLREEILTPGFLDSRAEERAIGQLRDAAPKLIFLANRPTSEFGAAVIGRDYYHKLVAWIEENYEPAAVLGPSHDPNLQIGDKTFFIRAYRPRKAIESVVLR